MTHQTFDPQFFHEVHKTLHRSRGFDSHTHGPRKRGIKLSHVEEKMDGDVASYIVRYYAQFMTAQEKLAHKHLVGTHKSTHGRSDAVAQQEAKTGPRGPREMLSDDPVVVGLTTDGFQRFVERTAKRILNQHGEQIVLNHCPQCGVLARTPKARQCRFCRHDWHDSSATGRPRG
jgi:hypothetical protein